MLAEEGLEIGAGNVDFAAYLREGDEALDEAGSGISDSFRWQVFFYWPGSGVDKLHIRIPCLNLHY